MKTATITVKVPDDFKKGNSKKCPFIKYPPWWSKSGNICCGLSCRRTSELYIEAALCGVENCPLEIQENNNDN